MHQKKESLPTQQSKKLYCLRRQKANREYRLSPRAY